jgi:hypothetical protein
VHHRERHCKNRAALACELQIVETAHPNAAIRFSRRRSPSPSFATSARPKANGFGDQRLQRWRIGRSDFDLSPRAAWREAINDPPIKSSPQVRSAGIRRSRRGPALGKRCRRLEHPHRSSSRSRSRARTDSAVFQERRARRIAAPVEVGASEACASPGFRVSSIGTAAITCSSASTGVGAA